MSDSWHQNVKNQNRAKIIAAGRKLFLEHNFLQVNVKEVCVRAEISRITFYKHFKSIDELIFEVQMDVLEHMTDYIVQRDNPAASGLGRIQLILHAWVDFAKEFKDQMKFIILFDLYYEDYEANVELKQRFQSFVNDSNHKDFLNSAIVQGIEDKTLKADLDPVKAGYYIFQTMMGVLQRMSYTSLPSVYGVVTYDDIAESVVDMVLNSVKRGE
ncbi:TetR/AcrR family transcriptional regulator [Paenibacillus puldeungensis]|uniref:TetR/AcrR family transcriptional regulator n=1 Tax=Paenibacillus puldeungensis TaxID=696536 RepID=A0ABW3RZS0_9BACL